MPRKKKLDFEEEQEQDEEEYEWDKPKLIITGIILLLIVVGFIAWRQLTLGTTSQQSVKGISTSYAQESLLPSQEEVKQQLAAVEAKVSGLSVQDIATASPQVQQVLQQLQHLPKTPGDIAKQACINICNKL